MQQKYNVIDGVNYRADMNKEDVVKNRNSSIVVFFVYEV